METHWTTAIDSQRATPTERPRLMARYWQRGIWKAIQMRKETEMQKVRRSDSPTMMGRWKLMGRLTVILSLRD